MLSMVVTIPWAGTGWDTSRETPFRLLIHGTDQYIARLINVCMTLTVLSTKLIA